MTEHEERGRADHRAIGGAEARRWDAQRMADALRDLRAEREVRRDAAAEEHRLARVLGGSPRGLLGEDLGDRLLERGRHIGDRDRPFRLELANSTQHRRLEPAEAKVVAVRPDGAREREGVRVAALRGARHRGPAGEAETEEARDLVEGLARGVVDRAAGRTEAPVAFHEHGVAVGAGQDEHDRGYLRFGRGVRGGLAPRDLVEPVRVDVALEVVHADEGQARGEREAPGVVRADEKAPDEPGPDRRGDRVDLLEAAAGVAEGLLGERVDRAQVLARGHLGDDAAGVLVNELRGHDVRTDATPVLDDRDAGLVTRGLDREDPHSYSSRSRAVRSLATRSRTERSRSRSVHMMSASSLLSE